MIHKNCFRKLVLEMVQKSQTVTCPECKEMIHDYEIKSVLNPKDLDEMEKVVKVNILKGNPNLIQCNCGDVMELVQG
eukprot:CAMPEP_0170556726 /NCGR_PEP_ID=MMETSP0211-20121228/18334_1 /TAXON_ID=311385 /ORGANISM="Pseudokeronopsis sp., Strain OXSARD2" /LENGTH=76 /DNA_ID=CAMNT_0010867243 /DNA_START=611 /DNA_END=841 /DNA_ORIENTATION=+